MLKAVIFDMDGVLVDSEPLHAEICVKTMEYFGITISPDYCYRFIGSTARRMFEVMKEEYGLSIPVDVLLEKDAEIKHRMEKEKGYPAIPYVKDVIRDLYKNGVKLAIASSSPVSGIHFVLKSLGITKYFDAIISGTQVSEPKPSPDIFLLALKELGVSSNEALVIEDSKNGCEAAKAANINTIGFINPNSGSQDLSSACVLIESFRQVSYLFLKTELRRALGKAITIASTNRLIIRELTVSDIKNMYKIYQNPEVRRFIDDIDDYLEAEIEKHKAYIKNVYAFYGYGLWGVFSKRTNELIGRCGIQNREIDGKNEIELGYLLDVAHWGQGYAVECADITLAYAFETLELERIVAVVDKLNSRSIKVADHIGMKIEKEIKDHYRDCYLFSISRDTYRHEN